MTDAARPEQSGLTAQEKYDLDHHVFRHRLVWALGIVVLVTTGFAVLLAIVASERFYRLDAPVLAAPACWTAAVLLYAFGARGLARHRARTWLTLTAVAGMLVAFTWPSALLAHVSGERGSTMEATVASPDGRHVLVAESFRGVGDSSCRVWLREREGPLSRQELVWERVQGPCPEDMAFVGDDEIRVDTGRERTTPFDADEMWVASL
ncbi:hypothetical protein [Halostreptopolyspora alba]|uniref:Uncharacterized protein n=1 Tax=Halostreptopolyspora alba TaxID=2487137 RepID=A0A3N0E578_9ACTN|nr:hypothetical protein EFW17_17435 [Nocardiopsaceae bacterium YIM 96095]